MSVEEVESLMDELEAGKTMATQISTMVVTASAVTTSTTEALEHIQEKQAVTTAPKKPDAALKAQSVPATTSQAHTLQIPYSSSNSPEPVTSSEPTKIGVYMTKNSKKENDRRYTMERALETDLYNPDHHYFDNVGLTSLAVPLSFDESGTFDAPSSRAMPSKSASSSSKSSPAWVANLSSRIAHTEGGLREIITISFSTLGAMLSSSRYLKQANDARGDGGVIEIKVLKKEKQLEVSGPIGSNIRGFVMRNCP